MKTRKPGRTGPDVSPIRLGCMTYGTPERGPHPWTLPEAEAVARIAAAREPGVAAPAVGASKPHHLDDAVAALDLGPTADEVAALEAPYVPHAVAGFV